MRKILILVMFIPILGIAQENNPFKHFVLKNGQISYENVFEVPGINKESLFKQLSQFLPSIPSISQFNADTTAITARLHDAHIPYQKYGGHLVGGWAPVKVPISANITVLIKDEKYKIIVAGIDFDMTDLGKDWSRMTLEELATVKKRSQFRKSNTVYGGMTILQNYFTVTFDLNKQNNDNW